MPALLFLTLVIFLIAGYPVAFTLGGVAIFFGLITVGMDFFSLLPMRIWGIMNNYVLIAVPLFVYMGVMLERSGIAEELLETMALIFGKLHGGLAISIVIVGTLLAASTGIVGATVVTMGLLSLPTMLKRGYNPEVASGTISASGTLGQIIPPSIILVLLGSVLNVSVGDLFMAALIPSLILLTLYVLWIVILAFLRPDLVPAMPDDELDKFKGKAMVMQLGKAFIPPFLLILCVLGSIFAGIASPTEAAAVGASGASLLTIIKGKMNVKTLKSVMTETTHITCMVFIILAGATALGLVFRGMDGDAYIKDIIVKAKLSPMAFLLLTMAVVFIAGFFIDFIEITFIIVPVIAPILVKMNIDPVWFGILMAMNLQTSFLTPPFGFALFYLKGVAPPEIKTRHIYKGVIPYIIIQIIVLIIIFNFPQTALWFPEFIRN